MEYLFILIGFAVLIIGANFLVNGSTGLAKRFNVPDLIIGLTVVAFGTSSPELVVNLIAALDPKSTDIALSNIIGSNSVNTFFILGMTALIYPVRSQLSSRRFDIPLSLLAPIILILMGVVFGPTFSRLDGIILLIIFSTYMYITMRNSIKGKDNMVSCEENSDHRIYMPIPLALIMIIGGIAAQVIGGKLIVNNAVTIAEELNISQSVIGLTIVALGTSLPELATSVVAAYKRNCDIALGNIIGSNIFNVFFILGTTLVIRPITAYNLILTDLLVLILGTALVIVFISTNKQYEVKRWQGGTLVLLYIIYVIWMIIKG